MPFEILACGRIMHYFFDADGWLTTQTARCPSPNYNTRPTSESVSLLVIHNISLPPGEFGNGCIEQFFCNRLNHDQHPYFDTIRGVEVSSHFLIDRTGVVRQFVSIHDRAWHAGVSEFRGRRDCNDFSVGIELEGTDDQPYTQAQYDELVLLTAALQAACPDLSSECIVGHSDIAPQRKTDPGPSFDWE